VACMFLACGVSFGQTPALPQSTSAVPPTIVPWQKEMTLIVSGEKAIYPPIAEMAHVEGCVYASIVVSVEGSVRDASAVGGPALMFQSALNAVRNWKFKPSTQEVATTVPVCFFLNRKGTEKLLEDQQRAAEKHPDAQHLTEFGHALFLIGSPDEAEKEFRQALALKARDPDAEFGLGNSLAVQGDLDPAVAAYLQGLAATPKNREERARLASLMELKGDLDAAIAQYRVILQDDPHTLYRANLAALLLKNNDADGAIEQYRKAIHDNDNAFSHYGLGRAYEMKGDTANALNEYRKAVKEMPQNTDFRDAYSRLAGK
jgi:TonB family protein